MMLPAFVFPVKAQKQEHPFLIVHNADKPAVLEKIKTTPWAKTTFDTLVEKLNPYVERHKTDADWILSRYLLN